MKKKFAYLQLYSRIRQNIIDKVYPYGSRLPSKRTLAEQSGVSVITVEHAYNILCDEGYAEARERSGYFVIYREKDCLPVVQTDIRVSAPTVQRHSTDHTFPFTVFAKTMRRVLSDYGDRILIKSPNDGCRELREAIAAYLARSRGIMVQSSQVFIGSGAEYLYSLAVRLFGRDRIFALEDPSYEQIKSVYLSNGVQCDMLKMGPDGIRSEALRRTRATVLHVTPFDSYPSAVTASASKRREYITWARERNGFIVEDDFASEFSPSTKSEDTLFSLAPDGPVIYMNTFSKTIAPSIRVGYMVLPECLLENYRQKTGFYSCTVPTFEQYVLAEFINSGDFERHINRVRRNIRRQRGKSQKEVCR
ncbi:MAG: PLP-dependent aminotransferase family protein [Oscillospiraceae bacterium]|nr:PLP-dependent aminotransferase family protein [Oscillospiraceae bacterium]